MNLVRALLLGMVALFLLDSAAEAQVRPQALGCVDKADTWCVIPVSALGAQINLKTGSVLNAVALVGLELQHTFGTLPMGFGGLFGFGASKENQGSYQGCLGVSITNWGLVCIGAQHANFEIGSAWQGMLTLAGQLSHGGSPTYLRDQVKPRMVMSEGDF